MSRPCCPVLPPLSLYPLTLLAYSWLILHITDCHGTKPVVRTLFILCWLSLYFHLHSLHGLIAPTRGCCRCVSLLATKFEPDYWLHSDWLLALMCLLVTLLLLAPASIHLRVYICTCFLRVVASTVSCFPSLQQLWILLPLFSLMLGLLYLYLLASGRYTYIQFSRPHFNLSLLAYLAPCLLLSFRPAF